MLNILNALINNLIFDLEPFLRIASGLVIGFVMIKLIKMQIRAVKDFKECKVVDNGYRVVKTLFKLTDFDLATLIVFILGCYFLREFFMFGKFFSAEVVVILLSAITLTIKNIILERQYKNRYLLLSILSMSKGSSENIIGVSNGELEIESFHKAITPLLRAEIVSNYLEGQLLEGRVIYSITPKGVNHYLDYLNIEQNNLAKEKHHLKRKSSISHDVFVDVEYCQVSERLELVERNIALLTNTK